MAGCAGRRVAAAQRTQDRVHVVKSPRTLGCRVRSRPRFVTDTTVTWKRTRGQGVRRRWEVSHLHARMPGAFPSGVWERGGTRGQGNVPPLPRVHRRVGVNAERRRRRRRGCRRRVALGRRAALGRHRSQSGQSFLSGLQVRVDVQRLLKLQLGFIPTVHQREDIGQIGVGFRGAGSRPQECFQSFALASGPRQQQAQIIVGSSQVGGQFQRTAQVRFWRPPIAGADSSCNPDRSADPRFSRPVPAPAHNTSRPPDTRRCGRAAARAGDRRRLVGAPS